MEENLMDLSDEQLSNLFEPHQVRLLREREELHDRLFKLQDAIRKPTFRLITVPDRDLLVSQSRAMESYLRILDKRIQRFYPSWEV
jgi:hypothetical protein